MSDDKVRGNVFVNRHEYDRLAAELAECRRKLDIEAGLCGNARTKVDELTHSLAAAEKERDAYKKAKAENDERFMIERDEARAERDECVKRLATARIQVADLERELERLKSGDCSLTCVQLQAERERADALQAMVALQSSGATIDAIARERDQLKAEVEGLRKLNEIQKTYLQAAEQNDKKLRAALERIATESWSKEMLKQFAREALEDKK